MKTLYLVRHSKSSWKHPELSDLERPLNKRGKKDAPSMGIFLKKNKEIPEQIISSPAKRALSTAKRLAGELGIKKGDIELEKNLYMADTEDFISVIGKTDDSVSSLMILGHNPGLTSFVNFISDSDIDNIPTSGIVRIDFNINSWKDLHNQKGRKIFFKYPKKYADQ